MIYFHAQILIKDIVIFKVSDVNNKLLNNANTCCDVQQILFTYI